MMAQKCHGYHGWENWETWNANNFLSSNEAFYQSCRHRSKEEVKVLIQDVIEGWKKSIPSGLFINLIGAAYVDEIDVDQLVRAFYEPEEEEDDYN